jgi:ABC-type molybdate transport system permease subunit
MEPKLPRSPYYRPLVINGVMLLVMGLWFAAMALPRHSANDSVVGGFILVTLALPFVNGGFALAALFSRRRVAAGSFALCTLIWGGWAVFFITNTVLSFHKIGG